MNTNNLQTNAYVTPRQGPNRKQSQNQILIIQGKGGGTANKEVDAARFTKSGYDNDRTQGASISISGDVTNSRLKQGQPQINLKLSSITYPTRDTPQVTGADRAVRQQEDVQEDQTEIQVASTPPYLLVPEKDPKIMVEATADSPSN